MAISISEVGELDLDLTVLHAGSNVTQLVIKLFPFYFPIVSNLY
jgi:hypothetical protein